YAVVDRRPIRRAQGWEAELARVRRVVEAKREELAVDGAAIFAAKIPADRADAALVAAGTRFAADTAATELRADGTARFVVEFGRAGPLAADRAPRLAIVRRVDGAVGNGHSLDRATVAAARPAVRVIRATDVARTAGREAAFPATTAALAVLAPPRFRWG